MNSFQEIKEQIDNSKSIIVTAHVNPDGDAIGAGLAMTLALKKYGKDVRFVLQDKNPDTTNFLQGIELVEKYDKNKSYENDLTICVDCATKERLGETQSLLENKKSINFDHHISNTLYADLNCVKNISSTSELVYNFLKDSDMELDKSIGEALYTGLVNDTGNFQHDNVTENTFKMAADLKKLGIKNSKIVREFMNTKTLAAIKLMGKAMFDMKFDENKKLAYYFMTREDLDMYNGRKEDTEGIVEKLLSLDKAEVSLFLREDTKGVIKGSMRSKHDIDVNKIAAIFNGGGHTKAAGFTSNFTGDKIIEIVLENL
ncbi:MULTISPECIES: bifunctional oligoribonuclease/PAP phosphatase NrnA [Fusobacterium]|jgi:phosphoesterase RecJ-like protein|uniref:DHH family phosphoesterase n=1 Tax=Fusobacterium TaxID=848 RepID=UPI000C701AB8|nr:MULTISPECIES: bifunctional oligoribonuclease/PAP phosphatase NrnA [Fusobacterium]